MTVVFPLMSFFPSQIGGPNNTIYWHVVALKLKGINSIVITTNYGVSSDHSIKYDSWINMNGIKVVYLSNSIWLPFKYVYYSITSLKRANIIQFSSFFFWPNLIIAIYARYIGKKIVWSPRGELSGHALLFGSPFKKLYIFFVRTFLANKILFHGTCKKEVLQISHNLGKSSKVFELPNGIIFPKYLGFKNEKYFLFLGRIHPIKGLDKLILALEHSKYFSKSNYKLKIAGSVDNTNETFAYLKWLQSLISKINLNNKVELLGHIDHDKEKLLSNAYFLILPSNTENFGNVVIESLSQGTPVIASKGTPWEILEQKKAGFWVNNDPLSLARIIDIAIGLPKNKYSDMRKNSYKMVRENFDAINLADNWNSVYSNLINTV